MTDPFPPPDEFDAVAMNILRQRVPSLEKWPAGAAATLAADIASKIREHAKARIAAELDAAQCRAALEAIEDGSAAELRKAWRAHYDAALTGLLASPVLVGDDSFDIARKAELHADNAVNVERKRWER